MIFLPKIPIDGLLINSSKLNMPKKRSEFVEYALELIDPVGNISIRSMFGGYAIYKSGTTFALIADDEIYFKIDESNIEDFKKLNSRPFTYQKQDKIITMSYWLLPTEILENQEKLFEFVNKSYKAALKAKK